MDEPALFRLDGVATTRWAGDEHVHPLHDVSLTIRAGRVTAVVGPSGAGKSTLLRLLNRMEEPTHGTVRFHGELLPAYDVLALRRRVGLLLQLPTPFPGTVLENLRVAVADLTEAGALELLDVVGLPAAFAGREAAGLSGGEAQRVCLARALAVRPEVLLLDEATSALDPFAEQVVEQCVRRLVAGGLTCVLVSHDLAQARRLADDLLVVHGGTVVGADDPRAADFLRGVAQ